MYIGRFIDACGGENAGVAKGAFLSNWFKGKEFAFAFGVTLTCSRLGSVAAGFVIILIFILYYLNIYQLFKYNYI